MSASFPNKDFLTVRKFNTARNIDRKVGGYHIVQDKWLNFFLQSRKAAGSLFIQRRKHREIHKLFYLIVYVLICIKKIEIF